VTKIGRLDYKKVHLEGNRGMDNFPGGGGGREVIV